MNNFAFVLSFHSMMNVFPSGADLFWFMSHKFCCIWRPITLCQSSEKAEIGWRLLSTKSRLGNTRQVMGSHALCLYLTHFIGIEVTCAQRCQLVHLLIQLKLDGGKMVHN